MTPNTNETRNTRAAAGTHRVRMDLGTRSYDIHIGSGVRNLLSRKVSEVDADQVVIVSARPRGAVPSPGVPAVEIALADGEHGKTLAKVETLCREFAAAGLTRAGAVVSCGGGTTTDLVGLAASLYHRGIPVIHLPTTLLAQVDASVGGKTAANLPEGKNLVGAYWQPAAVLCDTDYLSTLPPREHRNGLGEIARGHFIGTGDLRGRPLEEQIAASVAMKAAVVAQDERDADRRHVLNYGHTLGHALEAATGFALKHGEAVAIGTVFAGSLAHRLGRIDSARAAEHVAVVTHYRLPTALPTGVDIDALVSLMRADKKAVDHNLAFVLDGPDGPELVKGIPAEAVIQTLRTMPQAPLPTDCDEVSSPG